MNSYYDPDYSIYDLYNEDPYGIDPNDDYKWGFDEEDELEDPVREDFGWFGEVGVREE